MLKPVVSVIQLLIANGPHGQRYKSYIFFFFFLRNDETRFTHFENKYSDVRSVNVGVQLETISIHEW